MLRLHGRQESDKMGFKTMQTTTLIVSLMLTKRIPPFNSKEGRCQAKKHRGRRRRCNTNPSVSGEACTQAEGKNKR